MRREEVIGEESMFVASLVEIVPVGQIEALALRV